MLGRRRTLILIGQICALTAAAGAATLVLLTFAGAPQAGARWIAVALGLWLLAIRFSWSLPRIPGRV